MSTNDNRGIPLGNAAIIAAVISAAALVVGALIGVVFGAKSQPIQVFLGADTPTPVVQSSILGLPLPQPTYTLLPTYTPYPIFTPARTIVAPRPITVIPTASADQQDPPPGSMILAGQSFTRNGVALRIAQKMDISGQEFSFSIIIENQSGSDILVRWRNSFAHVRDDKGKAYSQKDQREADWDNLKQFTVAGGATYTMPNSFAGYHYYNSLDTLDKFIGTIDPTVKYLVFTLDQFAGMSNLNWRYDLH